ncbi:MAG: hypothetical protein NTY64_24465 [Deltaproteobacteria bacterium]|nr:hypothetical protein [Deltaproteobacteria bacterium]
MVNPKNKNFPILIYIPPFFVKDDGFVKSPSAALRCILRRCGVPPSTPHSSGFVRALHLELFTLPSALMTFYEAINITGVVK